MLRGIALCMMLLSGFAQAAPIDDALRQYDSGKYEEAAKALAPLAESGAPVAQEKLSVMYFYGRGVAEDELRRVFNLGIGYCAVVPPGDVHPADLVIGRIEAGVGGVEWSDA